MKREYLAQQSLIEMKTNWNKNFILFFVFINLFFVGCTEVSVEDRASELIKEEKYLQAEKLLKQNLARHGETQEKRVLWLKKLSELYFLYKKDYQSAVETYDLLLKTEIQKKQIKEIWLKKIELYYRFLNQYEEAIISIQKFKNYFPHSNENIIHLSEILVMSYLKIGQSFQATQECLEIIEAKKSDLSSDSLWTFQKLLVEGFISLAEHEKAKEILTQLLNENKALEKKSFVRKRMAQIYEKEKDYKNTMKYLNLLKQDPSEEKFASQRIKIVKKKFLR